jgi:SAM-dependent methyltransferase
MIQNFNRYSHYYDLLYAEKNYEKEVSYVNRHIRNYNPKATTILELGSGTGNHAQYFSLSGYTVTGIERSGEMAAISSSKKIEGFEFIHADMSDFKIDREFDVAVSLFHSICYLISNESLLSCLTSVYRHLKPGGIFCFDFWYGPAVLHDLPVTRVKKITNGALELIRIADTEMVTMQNVAIVNYEMIVREVTSNITETIKEQHPMRYLSIPELDLLCKQTGFNVLLTETFLDGNKPSLDSWNVFAVLQKID